jgi:hypothetical protein
MKPPLKTWEPLNDWAVRNGWDRAKALLQALSHPDVEWSLMDEAVRLAPKEPHKSNE